MPVQNATMAISELVNVSSTLPTISIMVTIVVLGGIFMMLAYEPLMRKLLRFVAFLKKSFGLFFYGLCGSAVVSGMYAFTRLNVQQAQAGNPILLKIIFYPIVVYLVMTGFGWLIKTFVVDKIKASYKKATKKVSLRQKTVD